MASITLDLDAEACLRKFRSIRRRSEALVDPLEPEDCVVQTVPHVSPTKWHLAHTSWFFETFVLRRWLPSYEPFHSDYGVLFNSYYDTVGPQHPRAERGRLSRPTLARIRDYRAHVDAAVDRFLECDAEPEWLFVLEVGLQHEQQHQELLLMDIKHVLGTNPLRPPYRTDLAREPREAAPLEWIEFAGGKHAIGYAGVAFAFDNECPRHERCLDDFRLASRLVTNGEFVEFITDDGYRRPDLWLADGWETVQQQGWRAPLYWERQNDRWRHYKLGGVADLDPDEPVCHLSYYEADAYATWRGARLPSEAEWEVASEAIEVQGNFADDDRLHPAPATGSGLAQMFGDVWEFTASPYTAYPGFRPLTGSLGEYNGKFMCNQHVLRGGACITPQGHVRRTYRNFFYPWMRWQFGGLRLAASA